MKKSAIQCLSGLSVCITLYMGVASFNIYKQSAPENSTLNIRRDYINQTATIYLQNRNKIEDSLMVHNLNFRIDSLLQITNQLWHYIYSIRCGSNCKVRNQIIISCFKNKLHIEYAGLHSASYEFDDLYDTINRTLKAKDVMKYPNYYVEYLFNNSFFYNKPSVKEYVYKGKTPDNGTGDVLIKELKYDRVNRIYYTEREALHGDFTFISPESGEGINKKINEHVYILKFKESESVYLNNTWFEINRTTNSLKLF
jgi:hypothetical protein